MESVSKKWKNMREVYLCFKQPSPDLKYSSLEEEEMFCHESFGKPVSPLNGFYWCKRNMDLSVAMWREDLLKGNLFKYELYDSGVYPSWWLDTILNDVHVPVFIVKNTIKEMDFKKHLGNLS